ncbi:MAG: MlaD family protein, partial [bacterium]
MKSTSNNFVAGLFVIGGVAGFVLIVLLLSGVRLWGGSQVPYTVRFTLEQGASGLKPGSLVRVGGQRAGAVTSVQYVLDASTQSPMAVDVVVGLDASIVLFKDAMPQLELPLLGTVSTLNISFTGTPGAGRLERGGTLTGMIALPPFMSQAGFGNEQRAQVQQIIRGGAALISDGQRLFTRLNTESDPLLRDITESVANVKQITADIQARVGDWSPKITSTLTNAEKISADIEGSRKLLDDGLSRARELIDTAQAVVRDNRPRIDSTIRSADEL